MDVTVQEAKLGQDNSFRIQMTGEVLVKEHGNNNNLVLSKNIFSLEKQAVCPFPEHLQVLVEQKIANLQ